MGNSLQWIGWWENLQETIDFPMKIMGFSSNLSLKPISWLVYEKLHHSDCWNLPKNSLVDSIPWYSLQYWIIFWLILLRLLDSGFSEALILVHSSLPRFSWRPLLKIPTCKGDESATGTRKTDVWSAAKRASWFVTQMARWLRVMCL